jgi:hypothetical protein
MNDLGEHHIWYFMMFMEGSSHEFSPNLGFSNDNLVRIGSHNG